MQWRLEAFRRWQEMDAPHWAHVHHAPIDFQAISGYYSAPKRDEIAPKVWMRSIQSFWKPTANWAFRLRSKSAAGVAVDAVFDSVSVATTFKDKLAKVGVIFCPLSEAMANHPELVEKYLGSVVPASDNFMRP